MQLPDYAKPDLWLDDNNAVEFITWKDDAEPYMARWWHRSTKSETGWCAGGFIWRLPDESYPPKALWTLNSLEPLDISPSLLCSCGVHGFIKQGKWVPA